MRPQWPREISGLGNGLTNQGCVIRMTQVRRQHADLTFHVPERTHTSIPREKPVGTDVSIVSRAI